MSIQNQLLQTLSQIDQPGDFCTHGTIDPCFPGLEIENIGTIALPLIENQAKDIISQCQQAPFGLGEQTVIDTQVRCVWELQPSQFKLNNPDWQNIINQLVERIKEQLGLAESNVIHEIYKLLLYQPGDFFVQHRDTEKVERMFATLVIVLPSQHDGGNLIVEHDNQQLSIDFGGDKSSQSIQYTAFYADCQHEIKPVISGYRLCLVYNLALACEQPRPTAPKNSHIVTELAQTLKEWTHQELPEKLAVLFKHRYSQAGLCFQDLKNLDKSQADAITQAAEMAECVAHLGLVTLWESGDAEGNYGKNYWYGAVEDEDDYEMGEIYDSSLTINHWVSMQGDKLNYGELQIDENEIITGSPLGEGEPDQQEVEGPTGNTGATMDRWYHRAAFILWPVKRHYTLLAQPGQESSLPRLESMVTAWLDMGSPKNSKEHHDCQTFAQQILLNWHQTNTPYIADFKEEKDNLVGLFFRLLLHIDSLDLIKQFLNSIFLTEYTGYESDEIVRLSQRYGLDVVKDQLKAMSSATEFISVVKFSHILEKTIYFQRGVSTDGAANLPIYCELIQNILSTLNYWHSSPPLGNFRCADATLSIALIESVFKSASALDDNSLLEDLIAKVIVNEQFFNIRSIIIPALTRIHSWIEQEKISSPSFKELLSHCIKFLETTTAIPVEKPTDWSQFTELSCHCADCQELATFMLNSQEQIHRFRIRKDRRQHLHQQITKHQCDMTHVTERKGSPQTLVCTKNFNSFEKQKRQQDQDKESLSALRNLH